jgi:uncharacterized protein YndB with AHSA1/START domain
MGKPFEVRREATVDATPGQVWEAIATGPGIDSWFMGSNQVDAARTIRTAFGGYTPEHTVTAWEPGEHLGYRDDGPEGRFVAYEFLIAGRAGGGTVLRTVTAGFLPGDDWDDEFQAMGYGLSLFFDTLVAYLTHFPGRTAQPVTVFGPAPAHVAWPALHTALGLRSPAAPGDAARLIPPGGTPTAATVYHADPQNVAVRTGTALLRFMQAFGGGPLIAAHHVFDPAGTTTDAAAWQTWLAHLTQEQS